MQLKLATLACLATLALAGCQPSGPATPADEPAATAAADPAADAPVDVMPSDKPLSSADAPGFDMRGFAGTFTGTIPCADCPGIDTTLVLNADGSFRMTESYRERDTVAGMEGTWSVEEDDSRIRLDPNSKEAVDRLFAIDSPTTIVRLGGDGERAGSGLDYSLERQAQ